MTRRLLAVMTLAALTACDATSAPASPSGSALPPASAPGAPARAEERLVVVGGPNAEIVFALGAGADVVGTDTSTLFPPEATKLPKVGYMRQLAAEGILSLSPTRVLVAEESGPPEVLAQLEQAKLTLVKVPAASSLDEAVARIRHVAKAVGRSEAGEALASRVEREATAASARARSSARPMRVLFLYARGPGTMFVGGRGSSAAAMLDLVGATNAGSGVEGFTSLTAESAAAAAPEVILVPARGLSSLGGVDGLLKQPGLAETPAGKARRVVSVDDSLLLGFGPRLAEAIDALAGALASTPQ